MVWCECGVVKWVEDVESGLCECFFFQAEDGIRDAQESRGLGDVYKRQSIHSAKLENFLALAIGELS